MHHGHESAASVPPLDPIIVGAGGAVPFRPIWSDVHDTRRLSRLGRKWRRSSRAWLAPKPTAVWIAVGGDGTVWLVRESVPAHEVVRHPVVRDAQRLVSIQRGITDWNTAEHDAIIEGLLALAPNLPGGRSVQLLSFPHHAGTIGPDQIDEQDLVDQAAIAEALPLIVHRLEHALNPARATRALAAAEAIRASRHPCGIRFIAEDIGWRTWHVISESDTRRLRREIAQLGPQSGEVPIGSLNVHDRVFWFPEDTHVDLAQFSREQFDLYWDGFKGIRTREGS